MVAGIILFLAAGLAARRKLDAPAAAWWSACFSSAAIIGVMFMLGHHRRRAARALMFGAAAGIGFVLQAAVTKVFVTLLGGGMAMLLSSWTTYILIASALIGFVLQQSALKTGVLAPAMASSNAMTLFASVVLGLTVFGEGISNGAGHMAWAVIGLGIALVGIVLLAGAPTPERVDPASMPAQPSGNVP